MLVELHTADYIQKIRLTFPSGRQLDIWLSPAQYEDIPPIIGRERELIEDEAKLLKLVKENLPCNRDLRDLEEEVKE